MENKVLLIIVIGVIAIVLFDIYQEYSDEKRKDDIRSQQIASQTAMQESYYGNVDDSGLISGIWNSLF